MLAALLARPAAGVAVVDGSGEVSWGELLERASRFAGVLGDQRGQRVAILASAGADWLAAFVGVLLAGGMAVPLSPAYPASELAWFGADADVATVVLSPEHHALAAELAHGRCVLDVGARGPGVAPRAIAASDPALLFYTSGTTGKPKGAVLSHANLAVHTRLLGNAWALSASDRSLHALPLHHLHGLVVALLAPLVAGGAVEMLPRFDAARVVARLGHGDITVFMAVPTMYGKLRELGPSAIVPPRLSTSGSAALPVGLAEFWRGLTGAIPLERYGMTEIGIAVSNPLDPAARRPGSIGLPLPGVETRLSPEGELSVRGPNVFTGYWRRPDAACFDAEGWFATGDVAERDDDGYLRLRGRTSQDILKSGGYKISALEIEEVLREHPAVADAALIGLPDETWGERLVAVVEPRAGLSIDPDELRGWARSRLAAYKAPREVVVGVLPRNPMGKVVKAELRRKLS